MMPDFATVEPKVEIRIPNVPAKLRRDFKALCASKGTDDGPAPAASSYAPTWKP